jgi:hypothetical protein
MRLQELIVVLGLVLLALPAEIAAQAFEGTVRQRSVEVMDQDLFPVIDDGDLDESQSEAEWLRSTAEKVFGMPISQLLSRVGNATDQETTIYVKGDKVRYETAGEGGGAFAISDTRARITWVVYPQDRSYMRFSEEDVKAAAEEAERRAAEMMAQMGLDPEEIEAAQANTADEGAGWSGEAPPVEALGRTEEINGIPTNAYEAGTEEELTLGWCAEDRWGLLDTMKRLAQQAEMMEGEEDGMDDESGPDLQGIVCEGKLPVRVQTFSPYDFSAYTVEEILSIDTAPVSEEIFRIPEGFTEKKLTDMWK